MAQTKRRTGLGWLALVACTCLFLVSIGASSSHAQTAESDSKSAGTLEDVNGTDVGDPDMPTGDTPPPSTTGGSAGSGHDLSRGRAMSGGITEVMPSKRYGLWAHWKIALKLMARGFYLR